MPAQITMPQLSDTMTEGTVVKWLKKEGDKIKSGDIVAEVETDKATMEMESFESGTLAVLTVPEGGKVQVGEPIAILATGSEKIEDVKKAQASAGGAAAPAAQPPQPLTAAEEEEAQGDHAVATSTTAAPRAAMAATTPATRDDNGHGRVRISPLARRMAEERGIDLNTIHGSGPNGRIVQKDIETALSHAAPVIAAQRSVRPESTKPSAPAAPLPQRIASGQKEVVALTKMRATIAQRLQQAKQQIPHFYETVDIDVEDLSRLREQMNKQLEKQGIRISIADFIAKAIATALALHPAVNAHLVGNEIIRHGDVHLGMAVALPEGLIVPVMRNINQMGLKEIRQRSADLVDRARAQKLKGDEMSGATFTVSNLGTYGVKEFSAIINPPEVGILAIAAAGKRPVVRGDQVVARTIMSVTLSADHRAVDGATAAEFLRTLRSLLEEPGMMLV